MVPFLLPLLFASQSMTTPVAPIVRGTGLPPPGTDEAQVMAPIDALFAALAARDGARILAAVRPEGGATVAAEKPDGTRTVRHLSWAEFAGGVTPGTARYEERLSGPAVEIDGDVAIPGRRQGRALRLRSFRPGPRERRVESAERHLVAAYDRLRGMIRRAIAGRHTLATDRR